MPSNQNNSTPHNNSTNADQRPSLAIYPGTFDPITNGHVDLIKRALRLFDHIIITLAVNPKKKPLFSIAERTAMIKQCFGADNNRISVESTDGLIVDFAMEKNARAILRGLRAVSDFEYEFQLALMNRKLERRVETVFLMTGLRWIYISSTIIKDASKHRGDISGVVPAHVQEALREKIQQLARRDMNGPEVSDKAEAAVPPDKPRRAFLAGGLKWLTAIAVGALGYPLLRFITFKVQPKPRLITVNKTLTPGASHVDRDFILFMLENGPVAVSRICTHLGCRLNYQPEAILLECPCHQSRFTLEGGLISGPAKRDLPVFPVRVKKDDQNKVVGYVVTL